MQRADLIDELQRLPMRPSATTRVLAVLDDAGKGAPEVAAAMQVDPSLCARVLRLANSPYFGLSGRVGSVERAVVALGGSVIRSLVVGTAAGLFAERPDRMPPGFWAHSVAVAAGSSLVARMAGLAAGDALCAGLLHDVGVALIFRHDRDGYQAAIASAATPEEVLAHEAEAFGADHAGLGAIALAAWRLPSEIVESVRCHHRDPDAVEEPLARAVIAGEALARAAAGAPDPAEPACEPGTACAALGLNGVDVEAVTAHVADEAAGLGGLLIAG